MPVGVLSKTQLSTRIRQAEISAGEFQRVGPRGSFDDPVALCKYLKSLCEHRHLMWREIQTLRMAVATLKDKVDVLETHPPDAEA